MAQPFCRFFTLTRSSTEHELALLLHDLDASQILDVRLSQLDSNLAQLVVFHSGSASGSDDTSRALVRMFSVSRGGDHSKVNEFLAGIQAAQVLFTGVARVGDGHSKLIVVYSANTSGVEASQLVFGNLNPLTDNLYDLGESSLKWRRLYIGEIELGHASDTTITRVSAGDLAVENNLVYRASGTDIPLTDGGTGASTAAAARTNLGLGSVAIQDSDDVAITGGSLSGITGLVLSDGLVSTPALRFTDNTDCGLYRIGPNNVGFAIGGVKLLDMSATGLIVGAAAAPRTISAPGSGTLTERFGASSSTSTFIRATVFGNAAVATANDGTAFGQAANAGSQGCSFGRLATSTTGIAFGFNAQTTTGFALGNGSSASTGLAIGNGSSSGNTTSMAVGNIATTAAASNATASGRGASATASGASAFGCAATSAFARAIGLGDGAIATAANQLMLGSTTSTLGIRSIVFGEFGVTLSTPSADILQLATGDSLQVDDGAVATPVHRFTADTDTGFYRTGANSLGLVAGGSLGAGNYGAVALGVADFSRVAAGAVLDLGASGARWGSVYGTTLDLVEQASNPITTAATRAQLWLTDDTAQRLVMEDDVGAEHVLAGPGVVTVTIASGVLALPRLPQGARVIAAAESGTADTLDSITGGLAGQIIVLQPDSGDTITCTDNTDGAPASDVLRLTAGHALASVYSSLTLQYTGSLWVELVVSTPA